LTQPFKTLAYLLCTAFLILFKKIFKYAVGTHSEQKEYYVITKAYIKGVNNMFNFGRGGCCLNNELLWFILIIILLFCCCGSGFGNECCEREC
jgi:hypothetical protein